MNNVVIAGVGKYIPSKIVTNNMLSQIVETSDEWIVSRTGIKQRHITTNENTSDIASKAALNAIHDSNIDACDIDLIIVATCTPDMYTPATACIVQKNIGAKNAFAFDLGAACSGFIYGINVAKSIMVSNDIKKALVIGAETLSKSIDWNDRSTCVLFGDGAGAVVLSLSENEGILDVICKSKGIKWENLTIGAKDLTNPYIDEKIRMNPYLNMNGSEIFNFTIDVVPGLVKNILENNDLSKEDINLFVFHQANQYMLNFLRKKMKIDEASFYYYMKNVGNTVSSTIPIALTEAFREGLLRGNVMLAGFGVGYSWGGCILEYD